MITKSIYDKWESEYLKDLNISNRTYLDLNRDQMISFIKENYYDYEENRYVTSRNGVMVLGLQFLDYKCSLVHADNIKYFICIVPNNKKTNSIISEIIYYENCLEVVDNQKVPITVLEYSEVTPNYRNLGLNKELLNKWINTISHENDIITTDESFLGSTCHVFKTLKDLLSQSDFDKEVRKMNDIDEEMIYKLQGKEKKLTKNL